MNVYVIRYVPQFYHDLITMRGAIYADTPENEPTQSRTVTMHVVIWYLMYLTHLMFITICRTDVWTQAEFFFEDFEKRIFSGLFHRANSEDNCPEIKFQRIWPKFFEFFSDISFADGDKCLLRPLIRISSRYIYLVTNFWNVRIYRP